MPYILNLIIFTVRKKVTDRGKERQKPFGPGFLDIGNFSIGRSLRISEGEDRGNSPEYTNLLFPVSLNLLLYFFIYCASR